MADNTDPPNEDASRRNTSASLRLPKVTFEKVREIVEGSQQMSGSASAAVIADQIGRAAKGQAWSDRWGTAQFLGFIAKTDDRKYDITDLGRRFLGKDGEDATKAAQEALMRTGFGRLIKRFGTGSPNVKAMTNVLISDYNVPEGSAGKAADLLVEMATECRLVVDGRFKPADIERAEEEAAGEAAAAPPYPSAVPRPRPTKAATPKPATREPSPPKPKPAPATATNPVAAPTKPASPAPASNGGGASPVPFGLGPTVVLNIDATKLTAAEIGQIVRELRKAADSS